MVQEHTRALLVLQTSLPDEARARDLAQAVVAGRLAACVQESAIRSTYAWEGAVERAEEVRLDMKTTARRLPALLAFVRAHHPYDEPELIVLRADASESYAAWVAAETTET